MTYRSGPCLIGDGGRAWDDQDLESARIAALYDGRYPSWNMDALCRCGHPWGAHDIEEYTDDGSDMCCVSGCSQEGCPGRSR